MDSSRAVRMLLLLGLALGLAAAAAANATPLTTVTQIPRTDDEVLREAVTDGFLVDQDLLTSLPTQASQTPTRSMETTTITAKNDDSSSTTTPAPESGDRSTTEPSAGRDAERTTTPENFLQTLSEASSGDHQSPMSATERILFTIPSMFPDAEGSGTEEQPMFAGDTGTETTPAQRVPEEPLTKVKHSGRSFVGNPEEDQPAGSAVTPMTQIMNAQPLEKVTEMHKGHVTPDWVIIVGFLVGVAALVLLCVLIATRKKWNSRSQFNQTGVTLQPADQQRALEMQTFLKEQPEENGKAEEYTVIPLDELPETYSSS